LSTPAITGYVLGAATPTTVIAGLVPTGIAVTGDNGFPLAFVLIAAVLVLFAYPYLAAARQLSPVDASGAFYSVIRHGLGRVAGVGAGWVAVAAYLALGLGLYGLIGSVLTPLLAELTGVSVPWQVIAVTAVLIVGVLGVRGIAASMQVLMVLVSLEIVMIVVVSAANWTHPSPEGHAAASFDPRLTFASVAVTAARLALAVLGYTGTELTVIHSSNASDRRRGVARATYAAIAILTVVYVLGSSGLTAALGPTGVVAAANTNPGGLFVATAHTNLGAAAALIVQLLFSTSLIAGAISFHNATSRYAFFLGRGQAAPAMLGRAWRRHGSPVVASLAQTALALIAITILSVVDADPVFTLFYIGGTAGAAGALVLFALTAISTARIFLGQDHADRRRAVVVTAIAASVVLCVLIATVLIQLGTLLGVPPDSPLPTIIRLTYAIVFCAGGGWALWLRAARPAAYRDIAVTAKTHHQPILERGL
jgi:amino acid transporter